MPAGLRIAKAVTRYVDGRSETSLDPDLRVFVSDLVRPHGLPLREDLLDEGVGHSYGEMAEGPLREAVADGKPVDLLILAFDSPDVRPGAPASIHLSRFCPGSPLAFAVCDEGTAAAFTALQLAADFTSGGSGFDRVVVVLAEQTALHYRPAEPVDLPDRHCVVVLVCEKDPDCELTIRQTKPADEESASKQLAAEAGELGSGTLVLVGPGLPDVAGAQPPIAGQPFTGVWTQLAEHLSDRSPQPPKSQPPQPDPPQPDPTRSDPPRPGPVLVAALDRRLGLLSTLTLRAGP
ncbi:hypothetical protein ACGFZP_28405 [Kitasatospora sp. NPDC048239]|uniref:hypothetical protein n=1 Tax=Kitasatospora sp. NPDC048239 TaxID=3364046 RepID=UPI0037108353